MIRFQRYRFFTPNDGFHNRTRSRIFKKEPGNAGIPFARAQIDRQILRLLREARAAVARKRQEVWTKVWSKVRSVAAIDCKRAMIMATFVHGIFGLAAASTAVRIAVAAVSMTIWTNGVGVAWAAAALAPSADKLERITEFFDDEIAAGRLPGAVVLIQQHGKPVYFKCFGVRDVATNIPMTSDTIFALHSMTKPITSLAAMMLIDAGKLALLDPASKYIPGFADAMVGVRSVAADGTPILKFVPSDRPVTIMDLLQHTSGITYDYIGGKLIDKAYSESGLFDDEFDNKVFAERIAKLPLARQPGTLWRYGHSTDVIGRIIEIISGQTLYQFEKQHIYPRLQEAGL
jgi:CubicO group peptidase (beta-lactamase class C family)